MLEDYNMPFCSLCKPLGNWIVTPFQEEYRTYQHHNSLENLRSSASGCQFCRHMVGLLEQLEKDDRITLRRDQDIGFVKSGKEDKPLVRIRHGTSRVKLETDVALGT